MYLYAVALSGGLSGLKLCGSRPKPLNLRRWNNHAVSSRHVSGSRTGHGSMTNATHHTHAVLAI